MSYKAKVLGKLTATTSRCLLLLLFLFALYLLELDFDVHARGEVELTQRIDRLLSGF